MKDYCVSGYFNELPADVRWSANTFEKVLKDMAIFYPSLYISDVWLEEED